MGIDNNEANDKDDNPYAAPQQNDDAFGSRPPVRLPMLVFIGSLAYGWLTWELCQGSPQSADRKASYLFGVVLAYLVGGLIWATFRPGVLPRFLAGAVFAQTIVLATMLVRGIGSPAIVLMINGIVIAVMLVVGTISVTRLRTSNRR